MDGRIGRTRVVLVAMLALLILGSTFGTQAAARKAKITTRTVKEDYVGTFDPLNFGECRNSKIPTNIGMVCFSFKKGDLKIDLSVTDIVQADPTAFYSFVDSGGTCVDRPSGATAACPNNGFICGHRNSMIIPKKAVGLKVAALGGPIAATQCGAGGSGDGSGGALSGTMTVKITNKS